MRWHRGVTIGARVEAIQAAIDEISLNGESKSLHADYVQTLANLAMDAAELIVSYRSSGENHDD